jgi:hypothetical protein
VLQIKPLLIPAFSSERRRSRTAKLLKRHGLNASKPQSKMALSKRFKT